METLALHAHHARLHARFGSVGGREVVLHYGGAQDGWPTAEEAAMREAVAVVDLSARQVLRVTGPDRLSFLHGMLTQDVQGAPLFGVRYAALLTAKGGMVADVQVVRREEDVLLLLEPGLAPAALAHLQRYLISEEAELAEASAEFGQLALVGPRAWALARRLFGLPGEAPPVAEALAGGIEGQGVLVLPSALLLPGVDVLVSAAGLETVFTALLDMGSEEGLLPGGFEALEVLRVERGVPRYGLDMDERTLPLEANLERALHYQKGCYIGQEVIARATFRGHVNKRLVGLLLGDAHPAPRTELFQGERKVGFVTSVVPSRRLGQQVALGYVHRDALAPGTALQLAGGAGGVTVHALPFI
ncbi:MAG: YgfZ/GcvT domain-containing protein [Myxococcaceae bacterium]